MKVHLVDGTFELFRCFFGAPEAQDASGREVGATRGFLHTLVALLRQPDVTHVAIAFDAVVDVVRPGRAPAPLAGPGPDPRLRAQYPLAAEAARALGLVVWPMIRYQADDALATGAALYKDLPGVEQVVICTTDKDLAQCVLGTRVVLLDRIHKTLSDEAEVRRRFGVAPSSIPDFLALTGDPSDGLPGVPGFGPKTAAALLARHETIEAIPDDPAAWDVAVRGAPRLALTLRLHRLETILCRNLARKRTDVPIPHALADLEWRGAHRDALARLAAGIGEEAVLARVPRWRE